ncbi:actin-related protein 5 [Nematostella vectensis]|uniref:actin-related protein 5 n=1 Tax=Nematostella vectensis TaxID=45351 RepID=UPI002076DDAC|nr:actin-related protein 5 [Nematostella vectensis]
MAAMEDRRTSTTMIGDFSSAQDSNKAENIFKFKDIEPTADPFCDYPSSIRDNHVPIVIDNGGSQCRVGWATDKTPRLMFKNLVAKSRGRKGEPDSGGLAVGNDIGSVEMIRWALRTPFDRDVVTHYECQEQVLDHAFSHLGINTPGGVNHPVIMTEPVCNPNYCRQLMSELLFECYHVPSVAYGIDSLFSLYNNTPNPGRTSALVVSSGFNVSHVLPVLNGRLDARNCKRINLGGWQAAWYMQRLLQLKNPAHAAQITLARAQELVQDHTYIAKDYISELEQWASDEYYDKHVHKIQLPFSQPQVPEASGGKDGEKEKLRRQRQGKRLQEINARRREEKIAKEEEELKRLQDILNLQTQDEDRFNVELAEANFQTPEALQTAIKTLTVTMNRRKEKLAAMQAAAELDETAKATGDGVYSGVDSTSAQRTSPGDSKKRQRSPRGALGSKEESAGKRTKEELKNEELQKAQDDEQKEEAYARWLSGLHMRREEIMEARAQRRQRREELATRRSHASMQRMRMLSKLAYDPNVRDDGTTRQSQKKNKEDTFGQNDEDWMVYRTINKDAGDSDSEKEQEELNELENLLKKHDPDFARTDDNKAPMNWAEYYQVNLGVERIRVPEIIFQPSMLGLEQAGITETMGFILSRYTPEVQSALVQNVFVTGGNTMYNNFMARLERELLAIRPFQSTFRLHSAANPVLDAWCGARKWVTSLTSLQSASITQQEYEEKGGEYLKEHFSSNLFLPLPVTLSGGKST